MTINLYATDVVDHAHGLITFKLLSTSLAFSELHRQLTLAPILVLPNYSKPFLVNTDASDAGIRAVLCQVHTDG